MTDNGGASVHPENVFDKANENVVIKKSKKDLNFRVRNTAVKGSSDIIEMDPPIIRLSNQGENVVYPVLRGPGARQHTLQPGDYTDFKLEFNCICLDTEAETIELVFRPSFHTNYVFKVTKECEGLTAAGLINKEFQDSLIFDFFAFLIMSAFILLIVSIAFRVYVSYREEKGDDSIRNFFSDFSNRVKSGFNYEYDDTQLEMDEIDEVPMTDDAEFDPDDVLKTNSKRYTGDDFGEDIKVNFDGDEESKQMELPDI